MKKSKGWKKFLDSRAKQIDDNHTEDWYRLQVDERLPLDLESDNADSEDGDEAHLIGHDSEGRPIYVIRITRDDDRVIFDEISDDRLRGTC